MQQRDPLGPLLFCLSIHPMVSNLESELCIWYLDDESIGGTADVVERDLECVGCEAEDLGLHLNKHKTELMCSNGEVVSKFQELLPGVMVTLLYYLDLQLMIWSPCPAITNRVDNLKVMKGRLRYLSSQDALLLLHHAFAISKLLYLLRSVPCFFLRSTNLG